MYECIYTLTALTDLAFLVGPQWDRDLYSTKDIAEYYELTGSIWNNLNNLCY